MHTFWKLGALVIVVLGITAVTSTLTTAYLMRVPVLQPTPLAVAATAVEPEVWRSAVVDVTRAVPTRPATAPRSASASGARGPATPAALPAVEARAAHPAPAAPDSIVATVPAATIPPRAEVPDPDPAASAASAATASRAPVPAATQCDAAGRTWKIAGPGLMGTAVGAGLGAAGGAIASGGKGAGQGAIIGGLVGAALGSGYGAYRTKRECGNVFSGDQKAVPRTQISAADGAPAVVAERRTSERDHAAPFAAAAREQITIYRAH